MLAFYAGVPYDPTFLSSHGLFGELTWQIGSTINIHAMSVYTMTTNNTWHAFPVHIE